MKREHIAASPPGVSHQTHRGAVEGASQFASIVVLVLVSRCSLLTGIEDEDEDEDEPPPLAPTNHARRAAEMLGRGILRILPGRMAL